MGKINGCLKCLFIFFNVIFAIFGCLMVYGLIQTSAYSHQMSAVGSPSIGWAWLYALSVLGISCLGIYAGCSEKHLILKIFAGFMGIGMIIMMICGIIAAVQKNQVRNAFEDPKVVKALMQDPTMSEMLNAVQAQDKCCGITSASDWGNKIPHSCACRSSGSYGGSCTAKPQGTSGPDQIYQKPCSNYILMLIETVYNLTLGVCFGFAVVALLGLLISLLMIHQVKRHDDPGTSFTMKGY